MLNKSFQILFEKRFYLIVWNHTRTIVIEVGMDCIRDNQYLFITVNHAFPIAFFACHFLKGIFAEVTAMRFLSMDQKYR